VFSAYHFCESKTYWGTKKNQQNYKGTFFLARGIIILKAHKTQNQAKSLKLKAWRLTHKSRRKMASQV
jgi:hypothetical protein